MPSDEEEEDDDDEDDDDDRTDQKPLAKITSTKVKSNIPLPSDEEDNTGTYPHAPHLSELLG
jgi:hypothetical protein